MRAEVRNPSFASLACALALAPVAVLAYAVGPTERLDSQLLRRLAEHDSGTLHGFGTAVVALGDLPAVLAILAVVVGTGLLAGRSREAIAALAVVAGAGLTTQVLKQLLEHARYQSELRGLHLPWPDAFPSGHTTAAASLAVALFLVVPPARRPLAALLGAAFTAAMGFAVVLLQWHYPSDVVGALLVTGAWGFGAVAVLRALRRPERPAEPPERREQQETSSGEFAVSLR